ncbi:endoplasmic reticulum vesicle transporter-domain-containing protein [Ganoderma leucocontextum]|nr:endoplasmic reticulum vesicle transporter-domain-containing protein [Ganoderma leucocontextum]
MATMTKTDDQAADPSLLDKLDQLVPQPLAQFDAFPKLPASYKTRSESRGFLTVFVAFLAFLLVLNDLGEFIWGWPDFEFGVENLHSGVQNRGASTLDINVDIVVNMPCQYLSIDLRDAVGDRLYLSDGFKRDGTKFDIGQATALKEHAAALSVRQAVAQSRSSRGFFDTILRRTQDNFKPTYNHQPDASACRIYGTIAAKRVTANLHITTLGHGYASHEHVDHRLMNLSHVITEFSFGPYFPDITQPLDSSFEMAYDPFVAYQYFLHVVPTTYVPPRSKPLNTNQYSVTHYTRVLDHHRGTPGIFFKFDLEPLHLTIYQRTTTLVQFLIRVVGVVGGVFVCMGYAVKIGSHAVDAVTGADHANGIVAAESTSISANLRKRFNPTDLRLRSGKDRVVRQAGGWVVEGGSPYGSYANTPVSGTFGSPQPSPNPYSPAFAGSPSAPQSDTTPRSPSYGLGLGAPPAIVRSSLLSPHTPVSPFPTAATAGTPYSPSHAAGTPSAPTTPNLYSHFPPTPGSASGGGSVFAQQQAGPPPRGSSGLRHASNGSANGAPGLAKKDD